MSDELPDEELPDEELPDEELPDEELSWYERGRTAQEKERAQTEEYHRAQDAHALRELREYLFGKNKEYPGRQDYKEEHLPRGVQITGGKCISRATRYGSLTERVPQIALSLTFGQDTLHVLITGEEHRPTNVESVTLEGDDVSLLPDCFLFGLLCPPYETLSEIYEAGLKRKVTIAENAAKRVKAQARIADARVRKAQATPQVSRKAKAAAELKRAEALREK